MALNKKRLEHLITASRRRAMGLFVRGKSRLQLKLWRNAAYKYKLRTVWVEIVYWNDWLQRVRWGKAAFFKEKA